MKVIPVILRVGGERHLIRPLGFYCRREVADFSHNFLRACHGKSVGAPP